MKQCRFGLDIHHIDAELCAEIDRICNGGSWNDATRFYLRFLHRQSKCQDMSPARQNTAVERTDNDNDNELQEINLSGLDATFSELGE